MARGLNQVLLLGNVGGNGAEIRTTKDGKQVASFSLATTDSWKDKDTGELKNHTEWHKVVAFQDGIVRVISDLVKKGSRVLLQGTLRTREWEDKTGAKRYTTEIVLQQNSSLILLDNKASAPASSAGHYSGNESGREEEQYDPFNNDDIFS